MEKNEDRTSKEELTERYEKIILLPYFKETIEALPYIVAILNHNRQFIYSNESLLTILGMDDIHDLIGLKPGEAFNCLHAGEDCGFDDACRVCGSLQAIEECISSKNMVVKETRIRSIRNGREVAYDYQISATPYYVEDEFCVIISMVDISDKKRKAVLEHIFFHDILNTAGGLQGLIGLLKSGTPEEDTERVLASLEKAGKALIENIVSQRELVRAENGELKVNLFPTNSFDIVEDVFHQMSSHAIGIDKILVKSTVEKISLITDEALTARVLTNMVKNALEASTKDQEVTIGCIKENDRVVFKVHNVAHMEEDVQLQIFSRSFSTKGKDRGLGTYSMKLITEQYLGGLITFTSSPGEGTTFYASFPIQHPDFEGFV